LYIIIYILCQSISATLSHLSNLILLGTKGLMHCYKSWLYFCSS